MKFYFYKQASNPKLRFDYWVMRADEPLIKLNIWGQRKQFNCDFYTEIQALELIQKTYPEAIRIPQPLNRRKLI